MFQSVKLRIFFYQMYSRFLNQGWAIIAKAPKYLNIALPDFSVQYLVSSFQYGDQVVIRGSVPRASYVSLVVYDTYGVPDSWVYLDQSVSKNFQVEMGKDLKFPKTHYYAIIFRIYQAEENFTYPDILVNGNVITPMPKKKIFENSLDISNKVLDALSKRLNLSIPPSQKFFLPVKAQKKGLFMNPDAVYLAGSPSESNTLLITGILPKPSSTLKFVGFMACNLKTTETDDSIGWKQLKNKYRIFVSKSKKSALQYGYNKDTDHLLCWKKTNEFPIIVYREVNTKHNGLFHLESSDWRDAKTIMKINYPELTFFP